MNWQNFLSISETPDSVSSEDLIYRIKLWRNQELALTDFTQLSDVNLNKIVFATYRQELRDLPAQGEDPKLWVFPVPPT